MIQNQQHYRALKVCLGRPVLQHFSPFWVKCILNCKTVFRGTLSKSVSICNNNLNQTKLLVFKVWFPPSGRCLSFTSRFYSSQTHTRTHHAAKWPSSCVTKPACSSICCLSLLHIPDISTSREPRCLSLSLFFGLCMDFPSLRFNFFPFSLSSFPNPSFISWIHKIC